MRVVYPSIRDKGLRKYLAAEKAKHNGYDYTDFEKMLNAKVTKTNIARAFNVSSQTMWKWIGIYKEEQGSDKSHTVSG